MSKTVPFKTIQSTISMFMLINFLLLSMVTYIGSLAKWVVFVNGPGDLGSIQGRVIPKT